MSQVGGVASLSVDPTHEEAIERERQLISVRGLYFFLFCANGIFSIFINIYYREVGLSGLEIGAASGIGPLISIVASPIWSVLSDRLGKIRMLLFIAATGAILAAWGLSLSTSVQAILPLAGMYALFYMPIMSLMNGATLRTLGDQPEKYGRQRIWGSLGYILTSGLGGIAIDIFNLDLVWVFYIYIGSMIVFLLTTFTLKPQPVQLSRPVWDGLAQLVKRRVWVIFMLSVFILNLANSGMYDYLGLYILEIDGSEALVGMQWSLGAIAELPILFFGSLLLVRFSARRLLIVAYLLYAFRWFLYGIMPDPSWVLPIALIHGITLGPYLIAGVDYANQLAPPDLKTTAQGLFFAITALAHVVGSPISGFLFDVIGPAALFRVFALFGVVAFFLLWLGTRKPEPSQGPQVPIH